MSTFHKKKTYTGLLTNFCSFTSFKYKIGLIYTLTDRIFKINNTNPGFRKGIDKLSETLKRNSFPSHIINKVVERYLAKPNSAQNIDCTPNTNNSNTRYFKLPYIGNFSHLTNIKIKQLSRRFCKDLNIKVIFFFL